MAKTGGTRRGLAFRGVLPLRARSRAGLLTGAALALALLGPLLGAGFVLVRDMVFVPRLPLSGALLGLDGVPRAVPSDLLVALASRVVPGGLLQDLVLVAVVLGGAWGAGRLAPVGSRWGAAAAATAYGWSAYLHERLLLGQWALLVGWAVLPWAVRAALDWRAGVDGAGTRTVGALAVAACGGASSGLLVALTALLCAALPGRAGSVRRGGLLAGATVVLALPWLVPALLAPGGAAPGDPAGVAAFAADADTPFGVLGSLLTSGGIWAPAAVPPGRSAGVVAAVLVLLLAVAGLPRLRAGLAGSGALAVAAGTGLLLAGAGRVPGLDDVLRTAVVQVPGAGLLRDGQKWVAPLSLLVAVAAGCGTDAVRAQLPAAPRLARLASALCVLAPLAALPGAAWAQSGRLQVSRYPDEWARTARAVDAHPAAGPVVVLPWTLYRAFPWTADRVVLDPAPRWVARRTVVDDDLPLAGLQVGGEDPLAARLDAAAMGGEPLLPVLREVGAALVLVERTTRGADPAVLERQVSGLEPVTSGPELTLYAVPGGGREPQRAPLAPALAGDLAAALLGGAAALRVLRRRTGGATDPART